MRRLELRDWIGVGLIAAFVSVLLGLLFKNIPAANEQIIIYMLGQLSGFVATVVGYHYVTGVADAEKSSNTGAAFRAIEAQAKAQADRPTGKPDDPVHTTEESA